MLPSRKRVDLLQAGMILALLERKDQLQVPNQRATRYLIYHPGSCVQLLYIHQKYLYEDSDRIIHIVQVRETY